MSDETPDITPTAAASEVAPSETAPASDAVAPAADAAAAVPPEPVEPPASAEPPASPTHQVIYVETPHPPRARSNRVVGVLLALVGAVVFAAVDAAVGALLDYLQNRPLFGDTFTAFVLSAVYWVPILVFALAFILLVVVVNRGGWAAHVFGSLLLAFVVYFASIGLLLLVGRIAGTPSTFERVALAPQIIAAAVVAREVAIWFGLAVAARGRRVTARNLEARAAYEKALADQRAQYERPVAQPAG